MKLKYYLRGLGAGIIISTLILTISFSIKSSYISDEEIIERAQKLGMVNADEVELVDSEKDDSSKAEDDKNAEDQNITTDKTQEVNTDYQKPSERKTEETDINNREAIENPSEKEEISNDQTVNYVPFTVSAGQSSNAVAANLYKAGLVDDADAFNKYLNKAGVDGLIQAGTFYVSDQSTYDDIAAILVTKQDQRKTSPPKNE